jgi:hypothetical protein
VRDRPERRPVFYHPLREVIVSPMVATKSNFRPIGRKLTRGEEPIHAEAKL